MAAFLAAASVVACDSPGESESGQAESTDQKAEATEPEGPTVDPAMPGVEEMPKEVHQDIQAALREKKQRDDPTYRTHHKTDDGLPKYTNRLVMSHSPYLRQHAHNPVNWFPWGEEAFEKAERENKPVLLSVGYATCHWCHVMERESFEDTEIARYLNEHYVAIKVDRQQRPSIDDTYMNAVRMLSGGGGWPMTVWLTPDKLPFMGGTYFPPQRFLSLLKKMNREYEKSPNEIRQRSQKLATKIHQRMERTAAGGGAMPDATMALNNAFRQMQRRFDEQYGGFGRGNKFPSPSRLRLLLRYHKRTDNPEALQMVEKTLDEMANGGIYDQLGGGFHRYTTGEKWLVPHFEKMLYDTGQLATAYTEAWKVTKDPEYARIVRETLRYLQRDLSNEEGAIYAATDADSPAEPGGEDEEGAFFVWTPSEIRDALSEDLAKVVIKYYDVTESGNFEGKNILHTPKTRKETADELGMDLDTFEEKLERARTKLYHVRDQRPHPIRDDHIMTAWNGLALEAYAEASMAFDEEKWADQARDIAKFILDELRKKDGSLLRSVTYGEEGPDGFSPDYAFAISGLLSLYEATGEVRWLKAADSLQQTHLDEFWDEDGAGFFHKSGETVIAKQKKVRDGSVPSSNAVGAHNLLRLYHFTLNKEYKQRASEIFETFARRIERGGFSAAHMLIALDFLDAKAREIAFIKPKPEADNPMMPVMRETYLPNSVLVRTSDNEVSSLAETVRWMNKKRSRKNKTTAYVCRDFTCKFPTTDVQTFTQQISDVVPLSTAGE